MNGSEIKPSTAVPANAPSAAERLRLLGELARASVKLVAAGATLLDQVVLISARQTEVAGFFDARAQSWARMDTLLGACLPATSPEAKYKSLLQLARATERCYAVSADEVRTLIGVVHLSEAREIPFDDARCSTLLGIQSQVQQIAHSIELLSLDPALSPAHAHGLRVGIIEMLAAVQRQAYAAMRAAEATDALHAEAIGFVRALESALSRAD